MSFSCGHLLTQASDFTAALPLAVKPIKQEPLQVDRAPVIQVKQEPSRVVLPVTQVRQEPSQVFLPVEQEPSQVVLPVTQVRQEPSQVFLPVTQVRQEPSQVPADIVEHITMLLSQSPNQSAARSGRGEGASASSVSLQTPSTSFPPSNQGQITSSIVSHKRPRMETQGTQTPRTETQGTQTLSSSGPSLASGGSFVLGPPQRAVYLSGQSIPVAVMSAGTLPAALAHSTPLQLLHEREQLRRENEALQSRVYQFQQLFRDKQKLTLVLNKMGIPARL